MRKQTKAPPSFPELVEAFFADHPTQQRVLSAQTVAAYRDAFMLFLRFSETRLGKPPTLMALSERQIQAFSQHHRCCRAGMAG